MKVCIIDDCRTGFYARGYCLKHYQQALRAGKFTARPNHGLSYIPEHQVWRTMKQRCYNHNDKKYENYGGRGIDVSPEWLNNFPQFYKDMGPRPTNRHTIERIDNDKGYSLDNCRWATYHEQNHNQRKRKDNTSGYVGISYRKDRQKWRAYKDGKSLGYFNKLKDAIIARGVA